MHLSWIWRHHEQLDCGQPLSWIPRETDIRLKVSILEQHFQLVSSSTGVQHANRFTFLGHGLPEHFYLFVDVLSNVPSVPRCANMPDVLLSSNHASFEAWRRQQSMARTAKLRPDLLATASTL